VARTEPTEGPLRRRLVERLPVPLDDDHTPTAAEDAGDPVQHGGGIRNVVERRRGDDRIERAVGVVPLEVDPAVVLPVRRRGVYADRVVSGGAEPGHMTADRAAAELEDARRRCGQPITDPGPRRVQPAVRLWHRGPVSASPEASARR
jgi:hypothetical protein